MTARMRERLLVNFGGITRERRRGLPDPKARARLKRLLEEVRARRRAT